MWIGVCVLMNLGTTSGQMSIIPVNTAVGAEVSIHTFGAIGCGDAHTIGIPDLYCEHLFSIPA